MYYDEIISKENIKKAYINMCFKFAKQIKLNKYSGIDGKKLNDYDHIPNDLIEQIHFELINLKMIDPAVKMLIPKRGKPGNRAIFIHSIKDRVKAQAIYQVVEPVVNKYLSNFLFSYRSKYPHYKAAKSVSKRYRKYHKEDYVLIGDISDYSDNIDKKIVTDKIKKVGFDDKTMKLIMLFIENKYIDKNDIKNLSMGLIHGQPLISLFNNIYLDEIDKAIGKKVSLYRRVGDDFIIFDKDINKINREKKYLIKKLVEYKIPETKQKIKVQKASEEFKFLGYKYCNGTISISPSSEKKIKDRWKLRLRFKKNNINKKNILIKNEINKKNPLRYEFLETIKQYSQTNDFNQFKKLSEYFFKRLTIYYFGYYSNRNQRLTKKIANLNKLNIPSIYKYYLDAHTGFGK